jgi:hypothetical protein
LGDGVSVRGHPAGLQRDHVTSNLLKRRDTRIYRETKKIKTDFGRRFADKTGGELPGSCLFKVK